ncbi:hypothetical protein CARUB_v10012044mg [Capsella rubella]|uniref:TF-B3 domain-containing protein n=1 Tax=Capsella rubella TaxID=81985 RepID=R0IIH2_9BRAS|nr:hypothetical protein CARUB_v10012044mg [Capsella rubella]
MVIREEEEEASLLLFIWRHAIPTRLKRCVVEAIDREYRVFIRFPRKERTLRLHVSYSIESFATEKEDPPKADSTLDVSYKESSSKPTRNIKRRPLSLPPRRQQPKKATRMANGRFKAGASLSENRETTPEWLVQLMREKNGQDPRNIINRGLTATDVASHFCRLCIPFHQIHDLQFLRPSEERIIERRHGKKLCKGGVDSVLVGSDLKEFELNLVRWNVGDNPPYYLKGGWNRVVKEYQLKKHDEIRLWSFHVGEELYFAMVPTSSTESGKSISGTGRMSSELVIKDQTSDGLPHTCLFL